MAVNEDSSIINHFTHINMDRRILLIGPTLTKLTINSDSSEPVFNAASNDIPCMVDTAICGREFDNLDETTVDDPEVCNTNIYEQSNDTVPRRHISTKNQIPQTKDIIKITFNWVGKLAYELRTVGIKTDMITMCNGQQTLLQDMLDKHRDLGKCAVITDKSYHRPMTTIYRTPHSTSIKHRDTNITGYSSNGKHKLLQTVKHMLDTNTYSLLAILDFGHGIFTEDIVNDILTLRKHSGTRVLRDVVQYGVIPPGNGTLVWQSESELYDRKRDIVTFTWVYQKTFDLEAVTRGPVSGEEALTGLVFGLATGIPLRTLETGLNVRRSRDTKNGTSRGLKGTLNSGRFNPVEIVKLCGNVITSQDDVRQLTRLLKQTGHTIALTTGCYDIFHAGHAAMLDDAKAQADVLIVALNSDISIKLNKGAMRPICTLKQRLRVLLALKSVDFIIVFDERRPEKVARSVDPDVFVKGPDYTVESVRKSYPFLRTVHISEHGYHLHTSEMMKDLQKKSNTKSKL